MDFVLRSTEKATGDHGIRWGGKTILDFNYADDLTILDESGLKINFRKTKPLRLGISEDEKVTSGNDKIDQVSSPTMVVLLVKTVGAVKMLKVD